MAVNILFVCTGNTCRSPMAEGLFRTQLPASRQKLFSVGSAGTSTADGRPASPESVQAMAELGIDISRHLSRHLTQDMVDDADVILALSHGHLAEITARFNNAAGKTFLLSSYAGSPPVDVQDPFGESLFQYRQARDQIGRFTRLIAEKP